MAHFQRWDGSAAVPRCPALSQLSAVAVGAEGTWQQKAAAGRKGVGAGQGGGSLGVARTSTCWKDARGASLPVPTDFGPCHTQHPPL